MNPIFKNAAMALTLCLSSVLGNDTTSTATNFPLNSSVNEAIDTAGELDHFRITVAQAGELTLVSTGATDVYGFLLDAAGNVIDSNDDYGGTRNFRISRTVSPGSYFLMVRHYCAPCTGAYGVTNSFVSSAPSDDHGDTPAAASQLPLNGNSALANGNIGVGGDRDFFSVTVNSAGTLKAFSTGSTDTWGRLYNSGSTELASNDDSNGTANFTVQATVTPGTYYVAVSHYNATGGTGAYGLSVQFTPTAVTPPQPPNNNVVRRALVIGINDYVSISDLSYAVADARDMGALLTRNGWTVTSLYSRSATKATILSRIRTVATGAGEFLLFFSGHGGATGTTGFICPADCRGSSNLINETELRTALSRLPSTTKVGMIFDSCNSGAMIGRLQVNGRATPRLYVVPGAPAADARATDLFARGLSATGHVVITGCRGSQYSWELGEYGHGWLTWKLLGSLPDVTWDGNGSRTVSLEEAFNSMSDGVSVGGSRQEPQLHDGNGASQYEVSRF
jgi:hypothetical protein